MGRELTPPSRLVLRIKMNKRIECIIDGLIAEYDDYVQGYSHETELLGWIMALKKCRQESDEWVRVPSDSDELEAYQMEVKTSRPSKRHKMITYKNIK